MSGFVPPLLLRPATGVVWTEQDWAALDSRARTAGIAAPDDSAALAAVARRARTVIRAFSSSFFIVTRFLPLGKRRRVEVIYAAVRYPDEIVDTFPLSPDQQRARLDAWSAAYEASLAESSLRTSLAAGRPAFAAAFAAVVREAGIPPEHYRAFLDTMRLDIEPGPFATLDELVEVYIYGSATVVGYFLTHVYGPAVPEGLPRALAAARELAIALQLTNFLRDVLEDHQRGRLYLPLDALAAQGIERFDPADPAQREPLRRALRHLGTVAAAGYQRAEAGLDSFAADCRPAIRACIEVYRRLNDRCRAADDALLRESVPLREKLRALPPSRYWRLPLAYLRLQDPLEQLASGR